MTIIALLLIIVSSLIRDGIEETITLFTDIDNGITIGFLCWGLYLAGLYLRGYLYIQRFNEAVYHGMRSEEMHFHGEIVRAVKTNPFGIRSNFRYLVQLDNGRIVSTPIYVGIPKYSYKKCEAYYYKHKYYFTDFRRSNENKTRWWEK